MKLLCDEMLMRLGRWLRAAGYDTAIAHSGSADREIVAQVVREGRLLITCDRRMAEHKRAASRLILLETRSLHEQAREVAGRLHIDWMYRPFSRCPGLPFTHKSRHRTLTHGSDQGAVRNQWLFHWQAPQRGYGPCARVPFGRSARRDLWIKGRPSVQHVAGTR
ncbi:MAG: DUF5615 family PIN-like protein [Mariprofundaceae bacterium]|nr:DUF5615 family PIN-like protein [Mariprofundaceae bacterium]